MLVSKRIFLGVKNSMNKKYKYSFMQNIKKIFGKNIELALAL
jgi:hypothetical protein